MPSHLMRTYSCIASARGAVRGSGAILDNALTVKHQYIIMSICGRLSTFRMTCFER